MLPRGFGVSDLVKRQVGPSNAMNSAAYFDPRNQTLVMILGDGVSEVPVPLDMVDIIYQTVITGAINYSAQVGALVIMLLVVLTMTSRRRLNRTTALINLANLVLGITRMTLLDVYFCSSYVGFYILNSGDTTLANPADERKSIAATIMNIPQLVLIITALFLQAYSMIKLWSPLAKWPTLSCSFVISILYLGFKTATVTIQVKAIVDMFDPGLDFLWVRQADLICSTLMIFWFCFVFIFRLALHMWCNRSILPPVDGLSVMDILVMTNGVLMLVPGKCPVHRRLM